MNKQKNVPLYVLNDFLKFERKLYQVFGFPLFRPVKLKTILYALVIGVIEIFIYLTPVIGIFIRWIPPGILIVTPFVLAWLLSDIGTEDRLPLSYFKSFILYQIRKIKGSSFYRGRPVEKARKYSFYKYLTLNSTSPLVLQEKLISYKDATVDRDKALRYFERISNPEEFFKKKDKDKRVKNKGFLNFQR